MKIDLSRLKNIEHKSDGKTVAQCPACAAAGNDTRGEHLVIFPAVDHVYAVVLLFQVRIEAEVLLPPDDSQGSVESI